MAPPKHISPYSLIVRMVKRPTRPRSSAKLLLDGQNSKMVRYSSPAPLSPSHLVQFLTLNERPLPPNAPRRLSWAPKPRGSQAICKALPGEGSATVDLRIYPEAARPRSLDFSPSTLSAPNRPRGMIDRRNPTTKACLKVLPVRIEAVAIVDPRPGAETASRLDSSPRACRRQNGAGASLTGQILPLGPA